LFNKESSMKKLSIGGVLVALLLFCSSVAWSQVTSGGISGIVKDATGAVVANANITVVNEVTGATATTTTNGTGDFQVQNLLPDSYDLTVAAKGFQPYTLRGVLVDLNKTASVPVRLSVGSATSTVEVSAEAGSTLDTTTTNLTQSFLPNQLSILPSATVGLGVLNVSLLSPNVASSGGIGIGIGPSVDGNRPRNNNFTIEGIDNNDKGVTGPLVYVPSDAVGDFSLIVGQFSPEFGHSSGGQFNTNIKSGTNSFHGAAYEFFQNRNLNAENLPAGVTESKARYDFNRYGGQVGGPIKTNKLFFFGNFERQTTGQNAQYYVCTPTAGGIAALQTVPGLSATNLAQYLLYTPVAPGAAGIDASQDAACGNQKTGAQFLTMYSGTANVGNLPPGQAGAPVFGSGTPTNIDLGNYLDSTPIFTNESILTTSGDWTISPKDSFRARYIYNKVSETDDLATLGTFFLQLPYKYHLIALSEYHTFTPNLTNEARLGYNRYQTTDPAGSFSYPGLDMFPNITIYDQNGLNYGPDSDAPQSTIQNMYQFTDNIIYTHKAHSIKIGFDGRKYIAPQTFTQRVRGDYEYDNLTEFLHDLAPTYFGERSTGNFIYYGDQTALYGYANDTWRASAKLTINYGLRYEFTSVPVGERAQSLNIGASVPGLITFSAPRPQYRNYEPRIGVSYSINDKTQIRTGFSMANDVLFDNLGLLSFPPQYSSTTDVGTGSAPNYGDPNFLKNGGLPSGTGTLASFISVAEQRAATSAYLPNQVLPYTETFTFGVQRLIGSNYTAEARFTGTRGIHLPTQDQINVQPKVTTANQLSTNFSGTAVTGPQVVSSSASAETLANLEGLSNIVPAYNAAGFISKITSYQPYSQSAYRALSLSLIRRFNNGLAVNAAYTWSRTQDDATAEVFATVLTPRRPQNSQCVSCDYGKSALDRTQRLSIAVVYDLPYFKHSNYLMKNLAGNWEFSPIYVYESPEYATVLSGVNSNLNGEGGGIDRTIINPYGVPGTSSKVQGVYSSNAALACPAVNPDGSANTLVGGTYICPINLLSYVADDPSAYYIQAGAGTLPNGARNTMPIRPIDNVDLSAVKRINFTDRYAFEFQAQAFNVLNHPQYLPGSLDNVNTNDTHTLSTAFQTVGEDNKFFGQPQYTFNSNGRTMQLSAKLIF
jgi:hypothetical protein